MPTAVFVLLRPDGYVLLEERPATDAFYPRQRLFPGGKLHPGEAPASALVREMQEELGCTPLASRFVVHVEQPKLYYANPGDEAYRMYPWVIEEWVGVVPAAVLDTGHPLTWEPLTECLFDAAPPVVAITRQLLADPDIPVPPYLFTPELVRRLALDVLRERWRYERYLAAAARPVPV